MSEETTPNAFGLTKQDFAWLERRARNIYSQNGEDGILEAIFERIGTANQWCCECGAADGVFFSNTKRLIDAGWSAVLIEADAEQFKKLADLYADKQFVMGELRQPPTPYIENWRYKDGNKDGDVAQKLTLFNVCAAVQGEHSLDELLDDCDAPTDLDLLVIDVDGQDYWLFNSLVKYRPRVVVVEYDPNADPNFVPPLNGEGQAGLQAIIRLGVGKRYYPACATWCNVIFVQQDLVHLVVGDTSLLTEQADPAKDGCAFQQWVIDGKPVTRAGFEAFTKQAAKSALAPTAPAAPKVIAVTSIPQLGHNVNYGCQYEALSTFGISLRQCYGAFWHQAISEGIAEVLKQDVDYILTMDYDTLFTAQDVADLVTLAVDNPDVDVIIPCLTKREGNGLCAHTKEQDPTKAGVNLNDPLIPIQLGHFGLTLFKASAFDRLEKPWMMPAPSERGDWGDGHVDADMNFWLNCERAGLNVRLARYVRVGHIEYMATIPNADDPRNTDYVHVGEWRKWAVEQNKAVARRIQEGRKNA